VDADAATVEAGLTALARSDAPRVLSILASRFGDLDLADDAVQDALVDAARTWPDEGVPDNPGGWLMTTARRRAIDRTRAARRHRDRLARDGHELVGRDEPTVGGAADLIDDDGRTGDTGADERLRLVLLCCHPALDRDAQVALTLRLVGGLTVPEIAAAFLVPEATLAQRIVRAKRKIRDAAIPLSLPADPSDRLGVVLDVLYLVVNEGWFSRGAEAPPVRVDLLDEAIRLVELVARLVPEHAETWGLLALARFQRARVGALLDGDGSLVTLGRQDRSRWDRDGIAAANDALGRGLRLVEPGAFQVQALIAAHHANAASAATTAWPTIAALYGQLEAMTGSPVVRLNRAVAVAEADGAPAGLALLEAPEPPVAPADHHLTWAVRAELLARTGDRESARWAYDEALARVRSPTERDHLERRRRAVAGD
jgi:RNA polymerase sigma-70 factor (ECF subfamily)